MRNPFKRSTMRTSRPMTADEEKHFDAAFEQMDEAFKHFDSAFREIDKLFATITGQSGEREG